jgi:hypothetical protein
MWLNNRSYVEELLEKRYGLMYKAECQKPSKDCPESSWAVCAAFLPPGSSIPLE